MLFLNEEDCIKFLEDKGYCVYKMFDTEKLPLNCVELAKYFFSKFSNLYDIDYRSLLWKVEYKYAKIFISQMSYGNNPLDKLAISKCKYVIDTVFDNIDIFGVYYKFDTLKMLSADSGHWVVERCFSLDKNKINERTGYTDKDWNALYNEYEKQTYEKPDIEKVKAKLIDILGDK